MKKIIFLTVAIWAALTTVYGQDKEYQYHPWRQFKSASVRNTLDTVQFLRANFGGYYQNKHFAEKSLETVFQILDKDLPVKKVVYFMTYPNGNALQGLELIFDNRDQYKEFDQFHCFVSGFNGEYTINDLRTIFEGEPSQVIPLTKKLRQKLAQFIFKNHSATSFISVYTLPDPSTLPREMIQPFENAE